MISDVQSFVALHPGLTRDELHEAGCPLNEIRRLRSIGRIVDMGELVHGSWISRFYPYGARGRDISCMEALVDLEANPELVRVIDTETSGTRDG